MPPPFPWRYYLTASPRNVVAILALVVAAAACGDDTLGADAGIAAEIMRVTVGAQTVDIALDGSMTGAPIVLTPGAIRTLSAAFLRADGSFDPEVTAAEYRLNVTISSSNVTFTRTHPFEGTLRATNERGPAQVGLSLFHIPQNHHDFGPTYVHLVVQ